MTHGEKERRCRELLREIESLDLPSTPMTIMQRVGEQYVMIEFVMSLPATVVLSSVKIT